MAKHLSIDKENDIASVHKGFSSDEKFKGNIVAGDLILDISTKGRVRGIEILNSRSFFKGLGIEEELTEDLTDMDFTAAVKPNGIFITMLLKSKQSEQRIPAAIAVPVAATLRQ